MIDKASIRKEIKKGLKNGTILTEDDARIIANKYISENEASYEATLAISGLLPKRVNTILCSKDLKHPWFTGTTKNIVYIDDFGRIWSRTKGILKKDIKTTVVLGKYIIDALGGMCWSSKKGRTFVCEYRTSEEEIKERVSPQTFVG